MIHLFLLMSIFVSMKSKTLSRESKWRGSVFSVLRTFSLTFQTPTGMTYPAWASRQMTAPAVQCSLSRSSLMAILDA